MKTAYLEVFAPNGQRVVSETIDADYEWDGDSGYVDALTMDGKPLIVLASQGIVVIRDAQPAEED